MPKYTINSRLNGVEITFSVKPDEATRTEMKSLGYKWSPKKSIWYARQTESVLAFAKRIAEVADDTIAAQEGKSATTPTERINIHGVKVGDLFYDCFGYDATLYDFYQVVALKGKQTVVLRKVAKEGKQTGFCSWESKPIKGKFASEELVQRRTRCYGQNAYDVYAGDFRRGEWETTFQEDDYH